MNDEGKDYLTKRRLFFPRLWLVKLNITGHAPGRVGDNGEAANIPGIMNGHHDIAAKLLCFGDSRVNIRY